MLNATVAAPLPVSWHTLLVINCKSVSNKIYKASPIKYEKHLGMHARIRIQKQNSQASDLALKVDDTQLWVGVLFVFTHVQA